MALVNIEKPGREETERGNGMKNDFGKYILKKENKISALTRLKEMKMKENDLGNE